jgi:hypothetical protein
MYETFAGEMGLPGATVSILHPPSSLTWKVLAEDFV